MRTRFTGALAIAAALAATACNKAEHPTYNDRPVVTGYLTPGTHPVVTVSRQAATSSDIVFSGEDLNALRITINDGSTEHLLQLLDSGRYTDASIFVEAGKTYTLEFDYNGKHVSASTTIPEKPRSFTASATAITIQQIDFSSMPTPGSSFTIPDPIELDWTNDDNSYYLVVTENLETSRELIFDTLSSGVARPAFSFRNQPAITASVRINAAQFEYFGKHRIILYKLEPDYAALYEDVSNSSSSLTTAASNILNGFGIFTGINADTLYVQVNKK